MKKVEWIKVYIDMFSSPKIHYIQTLPEKDAIICIWIQLLCMAGKNNNHGYIYITETIPYDDQSLALALEEPINTVILAMNVFQKLKMIHIDEEKNIIILNFDEYQNVIGLEEIKEQNRIRANEYRARLQKVGGKDYLKHYHTIYARDNGACVYCGSSKDLCIDHLVPIKLGGDNAIDNLVLSCKTCNCGKSGRLLEECGANYQLKTPELQIMYEKTKQRLGIEQDMHHVIITHNHAIDIERDIDTEEEKKEMYKERKEELSALSEQIPYQEIIQYLNQQANTSYKHTTQAYRKLINGRWKEGFRLDDFKKVINNKVIDWSGDPNMQKYIRPETLFRPTHFQSYLNEKPKHKIQPSQFENCDSLREVHW
jgi:uncharacterized phage protein (TIGR02220 family)/predicted phage replisome organizer